ncbi:response regulator [Synoicihabitans lomoniglobus]|uniref:Response regulator n=1 Tax=Synoicihabitans lomoniglobus TaxID=2909285 RepID=A0AAF0CHL1_9BACT|nr:response regulator [Opitutaceae bacterium LMO-M01]WED64442.1 response regulator [Opitutaceae bacterium LMO-M01]
MNQIYIMCIDDEPDVLEAVERDLSTLEHLFPLETASSAAEARTVLQRIADAGDEVGAVFCDHVMPAETGVELMRWISQQEPWKLTKKALLTGQAGLEATINAVNQGGLDYYVAKPWTKESLIEVAKRLLTDYIIETGKDPMRYITSLDTVRLVEAVRSKGIMSDT